ncbi:uncharacterized protein LOC136090182 isoform X2 [Hydra vulgaris]|uniref:Uncharacterized protein LOC136090182 isoform X2 n=1 Tax=Hydra vulgaris TaxID=6087 RepID=A0ABM4DDE4_HYDVU
MNEDSCSLDLVHSVVESTVPVVKHVFATYADVCAKVAEHEMLHTVHYVVTCTGSMEKNFEELFKKEHKLFYEDKDFAYTGVPFIVSTRTKLDCQHRKDRNIKKRSSIVKRKMNKLAGLSQPISENLIVKIGELVKKRC